MENGNVTKNKYINKYIKKGITGDCREIKKKKILKRRNKGRKINKMEIMKKAEKFRAQNKNLIENLMQK